MDIETLFTRYKFPEAARSVIEETGIRELFPPQAAAVKSGVLNGNNLLMSVPTAAGKTLIAELVMVKALLTRGGRCLYIVPLKALASEKYDDFRKKYAPLGIRVGMATGDYGESDKNLNRCQILIATSEKIDSLLRSRARWIINDLRAVVLDEIHFINDGERGPTLEILTARIRQLNSETQIIALSATVRNAQEIASWLDAELVLSDWRPIPLREGVYFNSKIQFIDTPSRKITEDPSDDLGKLALDTLRGKGQVLVFVNSRRSAQAASRQLGPTVAKTLSPDEKTALRKLSKEVVGSAGSATKICRKLGEAVLHGSAFHHAGLKPRQRKLIEQHFKKNLIKVICSTPTLAAGVNLPARRAVIRDCKRFESGLGMSYIPTSEYKQCAGRAGRPQYDEYGEAVLMAKSLGESKVMMDKYILASPEPVISKLGQEGALRIHILSSIAGGYVHDVNDTFDFLSHTFLAHQRQGENLIGLIGQVFEFLETEGFIQKNGFRFFATAFGQATSRLYIDPMSAIIVRNGLEKIHSKNKPFSPAGILHLTCCCPDSPLLHIGKRDIENVEAFSSEHQDEIIMTLEDIPHLDDVSTHLGMMKTTLMLMRWIEEDKEEVLCDEFNIGPGDVYRITESARWLIYAACVFAELFEFRRLPFQLDMIKSRIQYGIREELIPLARLKGVGRVRARNLFTKGYRSAADLKSLDLETLAAVPQIGKTLAKELLAQVSGHKGHADLAAVEQFAKRFR